MLNGKKDRQKINVKWKERHRQKINVKWKEGQTENKC